MVPSLVPGLPAQWDETVSGNSAEKGLTMVEKMMENEKMTKGELVMERKTEMGNNKTTKEKSMAEE